MAPRNPRIPRADRGPRAPRRRPGPGRGRHRPPPARLARPGDPDRAHRAPPERDPGGGPLERRLHGRGCDRPDDEPLPVPGRRLALRGLAARGAGRYPGDLCDQRDRSVRDGKPELLRDRRRAHAHGTDGRGPAGLDHHAGRVPHDGRERDCRPLLVHRPAAAAGGDEVIDPRLLHQVTVEMTTGFLVLAGLAVMAKLVADGWTRRFAGRSKRLDGWAAKVAAFAEPASFVALFAGVLSAFVTMYTGSHAWSAE